MTGNSQDSMRGPTMAGLEDLLGTDREPGRPGQHGVPHRGRQPCARVCQDLGHKERLPAVSSCSAVASTSRADHDLDGVFVQGLQADPSWYGRDRQVAE
jgi:hypothetical protein